MRYKYLVKYHDITKQFKTKNDITEYFNCPLYRIDKIIRKDGEEGKCHAHYRELYNDVTIELLKPVLLK